MPQEDFEDLNVMNLTETKFQRAPTSESSPYPLPPQPVKRSWIPAIVVGGLAALVAVAIFYRMPPFRRFFREKNPTLRGPHATTQ